MRARLTVNGEVVERDVEPRRLLVDFLRQKVVTHQILSHSPVPNKRFIGYNTRAGKVEVIKMKGVQASVARCLRTPP